MNLRNTYPFCALLALLPACGGGGGGAAFAVPVLVQASFDGADPANPQPGDALLLLFSDAVEPTGAALDGGDLLVTGGSLGSSAAVPTNVDPRSVRVPLAADAGFAPGTSTVAFAAAAGAVRALGGGPAPDASAAPVTVGHADGDAPAAGRLGLSGVDDILAGLGPAGGTLQVPRGGFTIEVAWSDPTSAIDAAATVLIADRDVGTPSGTIRAGTALGRFFELPLMSGPTATFTVPANVLFPPGEVVLTALNADGSGRPGVPRTFRFQATDAHQGIRPLENGQLWFLSFDRDIEQFTFELAGAQPTVRIDGTPNGRADAVDAMAIIGLWSDTPLPNVEAGRDSNQLLLSRLQDQIVADLGRLFDGVDVEFTFVSPGTFPQGRTSVPYAELGFSQICVAGAAAPSPTGVLGAAFFDPNNQSQNDDCTTDANGARLGVFAHTYVNFGVRSGASSLFRQTFDPFTPGFVGTPIGDAAGDRERLTGATTDSRADAIGRAILRLGRALAVVIAHECGHSMGLVANDPMPSGLYGGDAVNFPTAASSPSLHIETRSLFPPDAQNVMSAAIEFEKALSEDTGFNSLNRAYLRERALYEQK